MDEIAAGLAETGREIRTGVDDHGYKYVCFSRNLARLRVAPAPRESELFAAAFAVGGGGALVTAAAMFREWIGGELVRLAPGSERRGDVGEEGLFQDQFGVDDIVFGL